MPDPANPNATADTKAVLNWLYQLPERSSNRLISGQHAGYNLYHTMLSGYDAHLVALNEATGKWPALIGLDYGFGCTAAQITDANQDIIIPYWDNGGLVTLTHHVNNPWTGGNSWDLTDRDLVELINPVSDVYPVWIAELDKIATGLAELQSAGVVVLWRPFHEMNYTTAFCWDAGAHPGNPVPYQNMWQHMFNYFTTTKALNNLLWVYAPADLLWRAVDYAYPGDGYVDVTGIDNYGSQTELPNRGYPTLVAIGKPFALTECGPTGGPPAPDSFDYSVLVSEIESCIPQTVWFLAWANDGPWAMVEQLGAQEALDDPWVITRDEVDWKEPLVGDAMEFATGTYTGNGVDDRWIPDVGFEADLVVVKGDGQYAVFSTSAMGADETFSFTDVLSSPAFANAIQAFNSTGFQVGTHATVNSNGVAYYWAAFKDNGGGDFTVGSYVGNGADDRDINVGWRPSIVWVRGDRAVGEADLWCRVEENDGDYSQELASNPGTSDHIQGFNSTGFQIGVNTEVNLAGTTFYYCCWSDVEGVIETGSYGGDAIDDRDITVGFEPSVAIVKNYTDWVYAAIRIYPMAGDLSGETDNSALAANLIQAFSETSFQIGTDNVVNGNGDSFVWMAFGEGAYVPPPDPPTPSGGPRLAAADPSLGAPPRHEVYLTTDAGVRL